MNAVYVSVIGNHFSIGLVYCLYMYTFILIFDNVFLFKLSEKIVMLGYTGDEPP